MAKDDALKRLKFDAEVAARLGVTREEFSERAVEAMERLRAVLKRHTDHNPMLALIFLHFAAMELCELPDSEALINLHLALMDQSHSEDWLVMPASLEDRKLMSRSLLNQALQLDLALIGRRRRKNRDADRLRELAVLMEPEISEV